MYLASIYFFFLVLVGRNGFFSTRFDEHGVITNSSLGGFGDLNDNDCNHIGSNCSSSRECCWPAACVLPSWSTATVCLVPGFQEEGRLQPVAANGPKIKEGVLYSGIIFNTSLHDFVINQSSSPVRELISIVQPWNASDQGLDDSPSPDIESSSTVRSWDATDDQENLKDASSPDPEPDGIVLTRNATDVDQIKYSLDTDPDRKGSLRNWDASDDMNGLPTPVPQLESSIKPRNSAGDDRMQAGVKEYNKVSINSTRRSSFSDQRKLEYSSLNVKGSIDSLQNDCKSDSIGNDVILNLSNDKISNGLLNKDLNTNFLKRFKFLIMKSTVNEATTQPVPSEVFNNGFKSIEDIVKSVQQLNDKLNQLSYERREHEPNTENSFNINSPIVRIIADSFANNSLLPSPTIIPTETTKKSKKISKWNVVKALFLRKPTNKTSNNKMKVNGDDVIDNVARELQMNNKNNAAKDSSVKPLLFRILGVLHSRKSTNMPTVPVKKMQNQNSNGDSKNGDNGSNIVTLNIEQPIRIIFKEKPTNLGNSPNVQGTEKNEVLLSGDALDPGSVPRTPYNPHDNSVANIMASVRHWFVLPTQGNNLETLDKKYENEGNSFQSSIRQDQCHSDKKSCTSPLETRTDVIDTDSYLDRSESSIEYPENNEGLYNDSYVFMINHPHMNNTKSESKWIRVLNFLHGVKLNPYHRAKAQDSEQTTGRIPASNSSNLAEVASNSSSENYTPLLTIRIPENLMPEALEAAQPSLTELTFSSNSYEEYGE